MDELQQDDVHLLYARGRGEKPRHFGEFSEEERAEIIAELQIAMSAAWPSIEKDLEGKKIVRIFLIRHTLLNIITDKGEVRA